MNVLNILHPTMAPKHFSVVHITVDKIRHEFAVFFVNRLILITTQSMNISPLYSEK